MDTGNFMKLMVEKPTEARMSQKTFQMLDEGAALIVTFGRWHSSAVPFGHR